jgi:hypothetical protein
VVMSELVKVRPPTDKEGGRLQRLVRRGEGYVGPGRLSGFGPSASGLVKRASGLSPRLPRDSPSGAPDPASEAILGPRNSAHNSGHSAHARPAETHKCTAFNAS